MRLGTQLPAWQVPGLPPVLQGEPFGAFPWVHAPVAGLQLTVRHAGGAAQKTSGGLLQLPF
jgi:hypothetical protein